MKQLFEFLAAAVGIVLMLAIQLFLFGGAVCLGIWFFLTIIRLFR